MTRLLPAIALAASCSAALAGNYPLGTMTCDDIGAFASEAMEWRKSGLPREQAVAGAAQRPTRRTAAGAGAAEAEVGQPGPQLAHGRSRPREGVRGKPDHPTCGERAQPPT